MERSVCDCINSSTDRTEEIISSGHLKHKKQIVVIMVYTLFHLENDRDVSAYSRGRRLSSRAQLACFLTRSKRNTGIDMTHKGCALQRVSLGALSDVTIVLGMRHSIVKTFTWDLMTLGAL